VTFSYTVLKLFLFLDLSHLARKVHIKKKEVQELLKLWCDDKEMLYN